QDLGTGNASVVVKGFTGGFSDTGGTEVGTELFALSFGGFATRFATSGPGLSGVDITHLLIDLGDYVDGETFIDNVHVVPEPSSFAFLALIATGGMTVRRRRKKAS
ncbi:MAG: PEP-CTERM sorting domain-containing protein, partial [Fuerstiella sp.]